MFSKFIWVLFSHGKDSYTIIYTTAQKQRVTFIEDCHRHRSQLHIKIVDIWGLKGCHTWKHDKFLWCTITQQGGTWARIPRGAWRHLNIAGIPCWRFGCELNDDSSSHRAVLYSHDQCHLLRWHIAYCQRFPLMGIPGLSALARAIFLLSGTSPRFNLLLLIAWKLLTDLSCLFISICRVIFNIGSSNSVV